MHGVRRGAKPSAEVIAEETRLARERAGLLRRALAARSSPDSREEALALSRKALLANPDEYSLWAFRRECLLELVEQGPTAQDETELQTRSGEDCSPPDNANTEKPAPVQNPEALEFWKGELKLTMSALQRHPKAYPAWSHRLWMLSNRSVVAALPEAVVLEALRNEFKMSAAVLARDGRNFHGWAHRMRVRAAAKQFNHSRHVELPASDAGGIDALSTQEELEHVREKINDDFANYSAWHHRSALLGEIHGSRMDQTVLEEVDLVRQAFYTEPDVQSAWFYHRWLLDGTPSKGSKKTCNRDIWITELAACDELLSLEPDARWACHARADLLTRLGQIEEARKEWQRLEDVDPMRRGFYMHMQKKLASPVQ